MTAKALSEVDEAEVVARYTAGASSVKLAQRFGVHVSTILDALERQGVKRRPPQEPAAVDTDTIVQLRDQGISWERIARQVGMSAAGVRKRYMGRARNQGVSQGGVDAGAV